MSDIHWLNLSVHNNLQIFLIILGMLENDEPCIEELKAKRACFVIIKILSAAWADSQYP